MPQDAVLVASLMPSSPCPTLSHCASRRCAMPVAAPRDPVIAAIGAPPPTQGSAALPLGRRRGIGLRSSPRSGPCCAARQRALGLRRSDTGTNPAIPPHAGRTKVLLRTADRGRSAIVSHHDGAGTFRSTLQQASAMRRCSSIAPTLPTSTAIALPAPHLWSWRRRLRRLRTTFGLRSPTTAGRDRRPLPAICAAPAPARRQRLSATIR